MEETVKRVTPDTSLRSMLPQQAVLEGAGEPGIFSVTESRGTIGIFSVPEPTGKLRIFPSPSTCMEETVRRVTFLTSLPSVLRQQAVLEGAGETGIFSVPGHRGTIGIFSSPRVSEGKTSELF